MKKIKIFACGDIIINEGEKQIACPSIERIISNADVAICNFEAPINSGGQPIKKAGKNIQQSNKSIAKLAELGFTHLSMANNHIFDFGRVGLEKTLKEAVNHNLTSFGSGLSWEEAYQVEISDIHGVKIGFLALAEAEFGCLYEEGNRGAYAYINHSRIRNIITKAKSNTDFLILTVHAGAECIPIPLPEWRIRYKELIDYGADIIVGHHPHVPQGYEVYKNKYIFYSLGNFHFNDYYAKSPEKDFSYSISFDIEYESNNFCCSNIDIHYHHNVEGVTTLTTKEEAKVNVDDLNSLLTTKYNQLIDAEVQRIFTNELLPFYQKAALGLSKDMSLFQFLKRFIAVLLFPKRNILFKNLILLHNIRIDTHRFVAIRYLQKFWEQTL